MLTRQRRSTQNMTAADPAKPAVVKTVRLTCGPNRPVTGASRTAGSSSGVFHIKLTPCGAFIPAVIRAGSRPCRTAIAAYRMNQTYRSAS